MQTRTHERLRALLTNAVVELEKEGNDEYGFLLNQLVALQKALDANETSDDRFRIALRAFPAKLRPMRAGIPAGEGLKDTRKLWQELNHIVKSRPLHGKL
jgi:hypothetical protein